MRARDIVVRPIDRNDAARIVRSIHYSGKIVPNSQIHLGVFLNGRCGGAMQYGPPMDKNRMLALVADTPWDGMLELNRMAFADWLPRNSESRAMGVAHRLLRKTYPALQWIVSFADGCQCGDGTIYRAAGFVLVGMKRNTGQLRMPDGSVVSRKSLDHHRAEDWRYMSAVARERGAVPLDGFQLKYVRFLDPSARARLTVPEIPFSEIAAAGASMYRGVRAGSVENDAAPHQGDEGGVIPTPALHDHDVDRDNVSPSR